MGEQKIRDLRSIEGRTAMKAAEERRSRLRDRFGRGLQVGDGILMTTTNPAETVWRITQITPAVGMPNVPPGALVIDVTCAGRILAMPGMKNENITMVLPAEEPGNDGNNNGDGKIDENSKPGSAVSPSGLIVPPDDGRDR